MTANAREEQQMSNENDEQNQAEETCPRCAGCGQLADSDDREPWSVWMALPVGSALAVTMGLVKPEPCDECGGTGKVATLKTPDVWCVELGVQILDADGWRGRDGRDWTDPISLAEFQERLATCTQRSIATHPAGQQHIPDVELGFDPHPVELCEPARCMPGEHHTGTLDLTGEGNAPGSPISDDAANAAARVFYGRAYGSVGDEANKVLLDGAREALEAAYPAIRQQVAEEIAVALEAEALSDYDAADDLRWAATKAREIGGVA